MAAVVILKNFHPQITQMENRR